MLWMWFRGEKRSVAESSWNVMAHGDARKGKWRGNWRMEWVASTLHTTSDRGVSGITTVDTYTSAASSRLNWRPCWFKRTRPFRWKTKSGFCACAITLQKRSTHLWCVVRLILLKKTHKYHSSFCSHKEFEWINEFCDLIYYLYGPSWLSLYISYHIDPR